MTENIPDVFDNIVIVQYELDKKIKTVKRSDGTILDTDDLEIRKSILSPKEILQ